MDTQTIIVIVTTVGSLGGLMVGLARMSNKRLDDLKTTVDANTARLTAVETQVAAVGAQVTAVETEVGTRIDGLQAEVTGLQATVSKMDGRLYDLAIGRHIPLIVPNH